MTLTDELLKYCDNCISDKILSCKKHKWACQRFKNDIEESKDKNSQYIFVEKWAEEFLKFMRLFKHTKGPLAGEPKVPDIYEKFFYGQLYGWKEREDRKRRFRIAYLQVGRKNAKSQDLAIVGIYEESLFGEQCSEVYVAATKKEQTKYVWGEADLIIRQCDLLKNRFKTSYGVIKYPKTDSIFARLTEEDKKKGDGGNPQCGILDEYHAHLTDEYYNILSSGMKTRKNPLLIMITTSGFDLTHPCYKDEYQYVTKILDPDNPIENDRYLIDIYELDKDNEGNLIDDVKDEKVWAKSNPILVKTKEGIDSIRAELKIAIDKPEKMRDFLTKTMNVWVSMREAGYMDLAKWTFCEGKLPDFRGKSCYVGVDLSAKIDLTSVTFEFPIDDLYYVLSHSWMPETTMRAKTNTDNVPYQLWMQQGWITTTPGDVIDYRIIEQYIIDTQKKLGCLIEEVCLDPWGTQQISNSLTEKGLICVEIVQGVKTLSEPTKDFREMVYSKRVVHDGNPVLTWAMGNAVVDEVDRNKNIILTKKKSKERIDPVAATINAHVRAMISETTGTGRVIFI
jgi:phage terminase large subunit-like protein